MKYFREFLCSHTQRAGICCRMSSFLFQSTPVCPANTYNVPPLSNLLCVSFCLYLHRIDRCLSHSNHSKDTLSTKTRSVHKDVGVLPCCHSKSTRKSLYGEVAHAHSRAAWFHEGGTVSGSEQEFLKLQIPGLVYRTMEMVSRFSSCFHCILILSFRLLYNFLWFLLLLMLNVL